ALPQGEVEAGAYFRPVRTMPKEIRDRTSAKIAKETHRTPQLHGFDAAAITECEERVSAIQNIVGDKYRPRDRGHRSNIQDKITTVLDICCYSAAPRNKIRPDGRTKQGTLTKIVGEFGFPQICANAALWEPEKSRSSRGCIGVLGLKVIAPTVVPANFKIFCNVESPSDTKCLI